MISKLLGGIWKWIVLALGVISAGLYVALQMATRGKEKAEAKAEAQERRAEAGEAVRASERKVSKAQQKARESNTKARKERESDPDSRTGKFGSSDRL